MFVFLSKRARAIAGFGFSCICFSAAYGDDVDTGAQSQYEVKIVAGARGSSEILSGHYSEAITKLDNGFTLDSDYAKNTNLCVAYTLQDDAREAETHCKNALNISNIARRGSHYTTHRQRTVWKQSYSNALNNLGVFYALQGDRDSASSYLERANKRSIKTEVGARNNLDILVRTTVLESVGVQVASHR